MTRGLVRSNNLSDLADKVKSVANLGLLQQDYNALKGLYRANGIDFSVIAEIGRSIGTFQGQVDSIASLVSGIASSAFIDSQGGTISGNWTHQGLITSASALSASPSSSSLFSTSVEKGEVVIAASGLSIGQLSYNNLRQSNSIVSQFALPDSYNPLHLVPIQIGGESYSLEAGAMPSLWLSPRLTGSWIDLITGTDLTTFSRANTSPTYELDGAGGLVGFASGQRAIGYSPETGVRGGSIFGQRTQLFASPDAPATQSLTLSAVQHQLTLFGTGSVTLSGAATGTLTGTGASNRVSLSFTPTAGSVTFTVSGSVSRFNLTAGSVVYPHLGGAITCPADVLTIEGTNFSQWYQQAGGTLLVSASRQVVASGDFPRLISIRGTASSNRIDIGYLTEGIYDFGVHVAGSAQCVFFPAVTTRKRTIAARFLADNFGTSVNGSSIQTDLLGTLPTVNQMIIGKSADLILEVNGHIHDILYWPPGSPAENRLQQLSAAL